MRGCPAGRSRAVAWVAAVALLAALLVVHGFAHGATVPQTLSQANQALQLGEADKALELLHALPQGGTNLAEAQNLECRVHYALQQSDRAVAECEQAVRLEPQNSNYHLWLARALGDKANHSAFWNAYSLGKRVGSEFETAARLDPRNAEALSDLGDFDREAPGAVGGGMDKADGVAARLDKLDPARAQLLRARIAEARKDYGTAEREFKQAIASAAHPADYWTSLASFYRRRQRWPEMESAIHSCVAAAARDRQAGVALYDGAGVLSESNRDPALAAIMLQDYLSGASKSEEAPTFEAHVRLARLKKQMGDSAAAQREIQAALQLAHDYKPALEFKH